MASVIIVNVLWHVYLCKIYCGNSCMASVIIENVLWQLKLWYKQYGKCNYGKSFMANVIMVKKLYYKCNYGKYFMANVDIV